MVQPLDERDIEACKTLQKQHGTSYFFATRFLPKEHRWAVHALYAFFRVPDEIVDRLGKKSTSEAQAELLRWREAWRAVRAGGETADPVLRLAHRVFETYGIPDREAEAFFESMDQDTHTFEYKTYEEARKYMYGSAAVVGRMMVRVLGYTSDRVFPHAEALGYAMQWTNFLRDIDEDWRERGRVYLPQDRLHAHGLSTGSVATSDASPAFLALMQEEIARADALYAEAERGIAYLQPSGQLGVLIASRLYQEILRELEKQGRNPFAGRARTTFVRKCWITWRAVREWRVRSLKPIPTL